MNLTSCTVHGVPFHKVIHNLCSVYPNHGCNFTNDCRCLAVTCGEARTDDQDTETCVAAECYEGVGQLSSGHKGIK